jgi:hypothetical protein
MAALALFAVLGPAARAAPISEPGEGAGQTSQPKGLAVDHSPGDPFSGRLYVADSGNNRIDVFDPEGQFLFAFGWGVRDGSAEAQSCGPEAPPPEGPSATCQAGVAGAGEGQLDAPASVAVDTDETSSSYHHLYVVDLGNKRIEKLDPEGNFLLSFGEGEFEESSAILAAAGPEGHVFVADSGAAAKVRLREYEPAGGAPIREAQPEAATGVLGGLAVDSNGDIYVRGRQPNGSLCKYDAASWEAIFCFGTRDEEGVVAVAVDAVDHLLAGGLDRKAFLGGPYRVVAEYPAGGPPALRRFGYSAFSLPSFVDGIAYHPSAGGDVYASEAEGDVVRYLSFPAGPVIPPEALAPAPLGNTKATLRSDVNPEGAETRYHFEYVDDATYQEDLPDGFEHATRAPAEATEDPSIEAEERLGHEYSATDPTLHKAKLLVNGLTPETGYHYRAVAENEDGEATGPEGEFETLPPFEFKAIYSSGVGAEAAILNAIVNPLGIATGGYFEYIDDATYQEGGFAKASRAPLAPEELDFGSGEEPKQASAGLGGLDPATTYRYRVVIDNHGVSETGFGPPEGPPPAFRTRPRGAEEIPDERAYELVSPAQKRSAEIASHNTASGLGLEVAAPDGEALAFGSSTAFADPASAPTASQYIARRGAAGWGTENVNPFGRLTHYRVPYQAFTPDLRFAAVASAEPPLTAGCPEGIEDLYWRDNETGGLKCLTDEAPQVVGTFDFCALYGGASADGERVFLAANGAFAGAPVGEGFSLYEWTEAGGLSPISVLPGGAAAAPDYHSGLGGARYNTTTCKVAEGALAHAVSAGGGRVFWTYGGAYEGAEAPLLARLGGSETVQLDAADGGPGPGGEGKFQTAAADGSAALFTDPNQLTPGGSGGADLYRYDLEGEKLTDLTPGSLTQGSEAAGAQGVLGASEDATAVYFAATGKLSGEEENANGETAQPGQPNLYLYREGEGVRFIATLLAQDEADWTANASNHSARATTDGRHLAFVSRAMLSDYDNMVQGAPGCEEESATGEEGEGELGGDPRCAEVYLYDAESGALSCASCNPTGQRPVGPASLPGWNNREEGPRYLSEDGQRLFFASRDALAAADENGVRDVYEFERPGAGSCTAPTAAYTAAAGGCLYLVSTGKDEAASYLMDASASGRDVFFSTRSRLIGADEDERYDPYDYRAGGGFAEPAGPGDCAAHPALDTCRPPAAAAPGAPSPSTPLFAGPGNLRPGRDCGAPARRAKRLSRRAGALRRRAKSLRRRAARSSRRHRSRRLGHRSRRLTGASKRRAKRARRLSHRAKRCRAKRRSRR